MRKIICLLMALACMPVFIPNTLHSRSLLEKAQTESTYQDWVRDAEEELAEHSKIANTSLGPIEYTRKGYGPVVLVIHGSPGGYDQGKLIGDYVEHHFFQVLSVSRPGYLRTPLSVGSSIEEQADALVGLLDVLGIDKVAVLGYSFGSAIAFEIAHRHPHRVWGLVLESTGGQADINGLYYLLNGIDPSSPTADFNSWLLYLSASYDPRATANWALPLDTTLSADALQVRLNYVSKHFKQVLFLRKLIYTLLPLSLRQEGLLNDISIGNPWVCNDEIINDVKTPTLIIQSRDDTDGLYTQAQIIANQMPNAKLLTVENSGHLIWLGPNTKKWEKDLTKFLLKNAPKK